MREKLRSHYLFYFPPEQLKGGQVEFSQGESKHMVASLRVKVGQVVAATDGHGKIYDVRIRRVKGNVLGEVVRVHEVKPTQPAITLYLGILKQRAMEVAVEKCTELGISEFVPVLTERSVRDLKPTSLERLKRIAIEAIKQSLSTYLPRIGEALIFEDAVKRTRACDLTIVGHNQSSQPNLIELISQYDSVRRVGLWIGPEGGFTDDEMERLIEARALPFTLGDQRLRAETAAITAVGILRFGLGA